MAYTVSAQTVDRTKPPQTPPVPSYKLPPVAESSLPNGMRIVLVEDSRFPLVTARLNFQAGLKFDPPDVPGLAAAVAALLEEGTKTRTSRQISDEIDSLGGSIEGSAGPDALTLSGDALSETPAAAAGADGGPGAERHFPAIGSGSLQAEPRAEPARRALRPGFLAGEKMASVLYGQSPYAHIAPTEASIGKTGRAVAGAFPRCLPGAEQCDSAAGGQTAGGERSAQDRRDSRSGSGSGSRCRRRPKMNFPAPKRQIVLVDRPGSVQADIHAGRLAPTRT